jgi:hypothetical protein
MSDSAFLHVSNRDAEERYLIVIEAGDIRVFDFNGVEKTVNHPGGLAYLTGTRFRAVTVADYTFIVNRDKTVLMKEAGADQEEPPEYLRRVSRPPEFGGIIDDNPLLPGDVGGYTPNPVITGSIAGKVASIESLPEVAADGTLYEIQGSTSGLGLSFYVVRNGDVWDETVLPGLRNQLDELTLPHCLIREGDGTFTFAPFSWAPRRAGDEKTNPSPTFTGRKINDVFFYQNRLAFLSDENVVLSAAGDFGNFFRNTVIDLIDSDVVDVAVTSSRVSILEHAVLFNDGALLFSDQAQFALSNGETGVTPASVAIRPVTNYEVTKGLSPVVLGSEVYFAGEAAGHSVVYEYVRLPDSDATSASEITAHVPGLLQAGIKTLIAPTRTLLAFTGSTVAYAYQLYWNGNEKVMSAWRPWSFRGDVLTANHMGNLVHLVVRYSDGVYLEKLDLSDGAKPLTQPTQVFLDRRAEILGVTASGFTTFTVPYPVPVGDRGLVLAISGTTHNPLDIEWLTTTTFRVPGTVAAKVTFGYTYRTRIVLSQLFPVDYQNNPLTSGRLQIRSFTVRYSDTGYFEAVVYPYGEATSPTLVSKRPARRVQFSGKSVGTDDLILGAPSYSSGSFRFSVSADSSKARIVLENSSYMSSTFTSAEWEGLYFNRAFGR